MCELFTFFLKLVFPLKPSYCSYTDLRMCTNTRERIYCMNQSQPNQSYPIILRWRCCLLSHDFPSFILNYPPPDSPHALVGLLKLNGLRGGKRVQTLAVTLPADVTVEQSFFRKISDLYTFNVIFCNTGVVLFLYTNVFFLIQYFEETLPLLPPRRKRPYIYIYIYSCLINLNLSNKNAFISNFIYLQRKNNNSLFFIPIFTLPFLPKFINLLKLIQLMDIIHWQILCHS